MNVQEVCPGCFQASPWLTLVELFDVQAWETKTPRKYFVIFVQKIDTREFAEYPGRLNRHFKSLFISAAIGLLWIFVAHSPVLALSFSWSGLTAAIWFLPILIAAERQRERSSPGLIFLSEALAGLVATMGPLGWMSFQFGLAQGAAAEAAYRVRRTPGVAALGGLAADLAVMAFHPQLQFASRFGASSWAWHIAGALLSIFLATTLIVGFAVVARQVIHSDSDGSHDGHAHSVVLFFLLLPSLASARPCERILMRVAEAGQGRPFVVAVDWDGTVVDTDGFLVRHVIPGAVDRLLHLVPPDERAAFRDYLGYLEGHGVGALPEFFEESVWQRATWPFPLASLPRELAQRPGLPPGSSPLVGFWSLMSEVFREAPRAQIGVLPAFSDFYRAANDRFGTDLHWVVITARHDEMLEDIAAGVASMGPTAHPVGILGRGPDRHADPALIPARKAGQIAAYRGPTGSRVRVFIENDRRNLAHLRALDDAMVLLQMRRLPSGQSELVDY